MLQISMTSLHGTALEVTIVKELLISPAPAKQKIIQVFNSCIASVGRKFLKSVMTIQMNLVEQKLNLVNFCQQIVLVKAI